MKKELLEDVYEGDGGASAGGKVKQQYRYQQKRCGNETTKLKQPRGTSHPRADEEKGRGGERKKREGGEEKKGEKGKDLGEIKREKK